MIPSALRSWRPFAKPSPLSFATAELEDAKRNLIAHAAHREYYEALEKMLKARITRLAATVQQLSSEAPNA
jgi:hypothetical protein